MPADASQGKDAAAPDVGQPFDASASTDSGTADAAELADAAAPPDAAVGGCTPGDVDTASCGSSVGACVPGTQSRTCTASGYWGPWSACGGPLVAPRLEICGNAEDDDCDGETDEGCACNPVAVGASLTFTASVALGKLVPDPNRCMMYGLSTDRPTQVLFIDTATKTETAKITLTEDAADLTISPDGRLLVVAQPDTKHLSVIDPVTKLVTMTIPVSFGADRVVVHDEGQAFCTSGDQWCEVHRVTLVPQGGLDVKILANVYRPALALSADGSSLYVGESGSSGCSLFHLDASAAWAPILAKAAEDDYGYGYAQRGVVFGASGRHVYFAGRQFSASNIMNDLAEAPQVYAEDRAGIFAASLSGLLDAETLRPLAQLPSAAALVALAPGDLEVWALSSNGRQIHVYRVDELLATAQLGKREFPALPTASYFTDYAIRELVVDPVRPLVYGRTNNSIVTFATAPIAATVEIFPGTSISAMSIDAAGDYLYVGFSDAQRFAQLDLRTQTFVRHLPAQSRTTDLVALVANQVAYTADPKPGQVVLADAFTGETFAIAAPVGVAELRSSSGGNVLYVADSGTQLKLSQYSVHRAQLQSIASMVYNPWNYFTRYDRFVQVSELGGGPVFFAYNAYEQGTLAPKYQLQAIGISSVSPDGRLVISDTTVRDAATGTVLGTLADGGYRQAVSSDGQTLYFATQNGISAVSLANF